MDVLIRRTDPKHVSVTNGTRDTVRTAYPPSTLGQYVMYILVFAFGLNPSSQSCDRRVRWSTRRRLFGGICSAGRPDLRTAHRRLLCVVHCRDRLAPHGGHGLRGVHRPRSWTPMAPKEELIVLFGRTRDSRTATRDRSVLILGTVLMGRVFVLRR